MKKKILIMTTGMHGGGVEKALLNMLEKLPRDKFEITLLLLQKEGEFLGLLPSDIQCIAVEVNGILTKNLTNVLSLKRTVFNHLKKGMVFSALKCIYRKLIKKDYFYYLPQKIEKLKIIDSYLKSEYDLAICYHIHQPFNLAFVSDKINAKKKVAWVHNDFKNTKYPIERLKRYLLKYDNYFVVSDQLYNEFKEVMPVELHNRVQIFKNIISPELILRQAKEYMPNEFIHSDKVKILSIGRLVSQKGFDIAIETCKMLIDKKLDFIWCVIGEGSERKMLEDMIEKNRLKEVFILLGAKTNPYPYLRLADIYVQPSRHEGYGIAVAEARVLCKPIICTGFVGAYEQIIDGVTGRIVSLSPEDLSKSICQFITTENYCKQLSENLHAEFQDKFSGNTDIDKLFKFI